MRDFHKFIVIIGALLLIVPVISLLDLYFQFMPTGDASMEQTMDHLAWMMALSGSLFIFLGSYGLRKEPIVRHNVVVIRFTKNGYYTGQLYDGNENFHQHGSADQGILHMDDMESFAKNLWAAIDQSAKSSSTKTRPYVLAVINRDFPEILKSTLREMIERSGYDCFYWNEGEYSESLAKECFSNRQSMKSALVMPRPPYHFSQQPAHKESLRNTTGKLYE